MTTLLTPEIDVRGRPEPTADVHQRRHRERWRPTPSQLAVAAIAVLAAVLYTWALDRNGMANTYYAAAVRSGATSWKSFFFGSIDPGSFITVDKPPAALWVMELSARIFGFSSWSMLLPEAAAGVGSVLILHRLVRKWAGDVSAHLAAVAFALTPIAVAMFRFNNPDAFLTLLCLGAAWALWSAIETGRTRALVLCGILIGLAFDTKMLQAFLVVPAFALTYLIAGPPRLGKRIGQLLAAGGALLVSAGWWVAIVALWPAATRPYIGSTTDNSIISLIFGYNGLSRLFGSSGAGPGGGGGGASFGGTPGVLRMFNSIVGGQIAWFAPLACGGLVCGLWLTRRAPRTDRGRAGWILWAGWALACTAVFSLSKGVFHPYYTVQLAPAVAALAGTGAVALWHLGRRDRHLIWVLPLVVVASASFAVSLLHRTPTFDAWLPIAITVGAVLAGAGLLIAAQRGDRRITATAAAIAVATLLAGPAAYAVATVQSTLSGSMPAAGPSTTGSGLGGGPGGATTTDTALVSYLEAHRGNAEYIVAAFTSMSSASIIIESGQPVMTIGGFNGSDPAPTLAEFEELVAAGKVRYVLIDGQGTGGGPGGAGGGTGSSIESWVTEHGTAVPAGAYGASTGTGTLYEVTQ